MQKQHLPLDLTGGTPFGWETKRFTVKNAKVVGRNIISFQLLIRKDEWWHVVGYYFPSSDKEGAARRLAMEALDAAPKGSKPLIIRHLNADLDFPGTDRRRFLRKI